MALNASPFVAPIIPSSAQTALAIAIVRSKPPDIAIRDYVLQLREHCRPGQPESDPVEHGHYLDLVGYWQGQCQRAQEECDRLRGINIRLERSAQLLTKRTSTTSDQRPSTPLTSPKRKAPASPSRAVKRPRGSTSKPAEQSVAETQEGIDHDYNFLEGLGDDGAALTQALYTTHKLCRATKPDSGALCHSLVRTVSTLGKIIRLIAHNYEYLSRQGMRTPGAQSLGDDRSDFSQALTISARAFMSVLVGMTNMTDLTHDTRLPGVVICELVEMFKTTLLAIEASAQQTADSSPTTPVQSKKGKTKTPVVPKESLPARSLAHFLTGLLGLLDKTNAVHQQIFDGFVFVLLERVSKRLYYCTFGRHKGETIDANLSSNPEPKNETDAAKREKEALGLHLEVKALILILERAMGLAPHHMNPPNSKGRSSTRIGRTLSMKSLPSASKTRLSSIAKARLQRTLVACMYGEKADDEFLDVLTKPMPSMRIGMLQNVAKIEDKDVKEWYKEEVWRLVGWGILARENGW